MKKMKKLEEALKVSAASSAKISCACCDSFVGKDRKGLVSMAEFQTQICLQSGAVVKEKAMRIRADLKTVLHNDTGNPQILGLANPSIEVEYLSNTTSLLQSLNQGIIHSTKLASPPAVHRMEAGRRFLSVGIVHY
jgi:hypothetical protein